MGFKFNPLIFSGFDITGSSAYSGYKSPVSTVGNLPSSGNDAGDMRVTLDTDEAWVWDADGSRWVNVGLRSSLMIGNAPNAQGYSLVLDNSVPNISTRELELQPADASFPGIVTVDAQTFAGDKTFQDSVVIVGDLTVQGTSTSIDTQTLDVEDANITINKGGNDVSAEGAGLTVERTSTDGSIIFDSSSASYFKAGLVGSQLDLVNTSSAQTLSNKSIDADQNTITNIENADIKSGAAIDATKIADGSVSNTEFQYINSLTSNAQDQLDGKQPVGDYITELTGDVTAVGPGVVVATISALDATKIADGSVSNTEFQYINSLTSNAQDQLDDKADLSYVDSTFIPLTEKGTALGVATLDGGGKVPASQLPNSIMDYLGQWAASTNTPTLADGVGNPGDVYQASDAGTIDFGSGNITFDAGDWVIYSGTVWQKSINSNAVASVNGYTGIVSLDTDDIPEASNLYFTDTRAQDAITGAASSVVTADLTADRVVISDGSGKISESGVSTTELDYVGGVTSSIQDQLDGKQDVGDYITELTGDVTATGPGSVVATISALDATKIADGSVTNTEFEYINSLTSNAQDQLNNKQPLDATLTALAAYNTNGLLTQTAADTFTGRTLTAGSNKLAVTNGDGVAGNPTIDVTEANLTLDNIGGTLSLNKGGTGQTTKAAAFDALSPMTTGGDLIYGGASGTGTRLPNGTVGYELTSAGGTNAPVWAPKPNAIKNYLGTINGVNNNGNFEIGTTTGWSLGTTGTLTNALPTGTPTFGSGASGNLSISAISSGQLAGSYSLSYASSAATTAGNMLASDAFTIDLEDQAKPISVKFYFKAQTNPGNANWSGTSSNSFAWAIWDVTNSAWIIPAGAFGMTQSSGVGLCTGTFQTSSNSTQYRLVVYNANATSGAATVYFDDFYVGPQVAPLGAVVTDAISYTPTITHGSGSSTNKTVTGNWERVGSRMKCRGWLVFSGAAGTWSGVDVSLPAGYSIDTTALLTSTQFAESLGQVKCYDNGLGAYFGDVAYVSGTTVRLYKSSTKSGTNPVNVEVSQIGSTDPFGFASGDSIYWEFEVPIVGWSSNVQISSDTDTRVVSVNLLGSSTSISAAGAAIVPTTVTKDTHGTFSGSTYTVPVSGFYQLSAYMQSPSVAYSAGHSVQITYKRNGSGEISLGLARTANITASYGASGTSQIYCNAGDTLQFFGYSDVTGTLLSFNASIFRLSGPSVIAASETVAFYGNTSATTGFGSTTITLGFNTVVDTHSAFATNTYTVPVAGIYDVTTVVPIYHQSAGTNTFIRIYVNGGIVSSCYQTGDGAGQGLIATTNYQGRLKPGDTIIVQANNTSGGTVSLMGATVGTAATLKISRIGS